MENIVVDENGNLVDLFPKTLTSPNSKIYENGFEAKKMEFYCPNVYVSEITDFGFLYLLDHESVSFSKGS